MPFTPIKSGKNKGKYQSPSGRVFTKAQVALYYARGGSFDQASLKRDGHIILDTASKFVCEDTSNNVLECNCGKSHIVDAALRARRDPTRTLDLRRSFIRNLERRWRTVSRLVTQALTQQDVFGLAGANVQAIQFISMSSGRVNSFQSWIDTVLADVILGLNREQWIGEYVHEAYRRGWKVAAAQINRDLPINEDRAAIITKLAISELQGVNEAFSQRAVRAFSDGLLSHLPPATIARSIRQAIDAIGVVRSRATVQTIIVRANGEAALDLFQLAGLKQVSILPETMPSPGRMHAIRDATKARRTAAKRKRPRALVEVLTAGDDLVCQICEDIAAEGPYTIQEARGLIPAHPNCRCAFVPFGDERFAHDDRTVIEDGEIDFPFAYRIVNNSDMLYVGQRFLDSAEPVLARELSAVIERSPEAQLWEVDVAAIEGDVDDEAFYIDSEVIFEVTAFDARRNLWSVKAWPANSK